MMKDADRVCVITGATNGIGRAAAASIARSGYRMVLVGRDEVRGEDAVEEVKRISGNDSVEFMRADLSLVKEVKALAARFRGTHGRLDLLVNNAGAIFQERRTTVEGLERTFALNHLAYFVLTTELLDMLQASTPARIISVSSGAHRAGRIHFDDIHLERRYSSFRAYGQSKLANILFTNELSRRLAGKNVTANCMHPGFVASGFALNNGKLAKGLVRILSPLARSPEKGAETLVYLALSPDVKDVTGEYFHNKRLARTSRNASSQESAARLWSVTEEMIASLESFPEEHSPGSPSTVSSAR